MRYDSVSYMETWGELEKCVGDGLVRHIGLSNFNSKQVDEVSLRDELMEVKECALTCYFQLLLRPNIVTVYHWGGAVGPSFSVFHDP